MPEVAEQLPDGLEPIEKTVFSAAEAEGFDLGGRDQALVCGIETHVCVNQTVARPARPRRRGPRRARRGRLAHARTTASSGLHKAERAGAVLTSVETALFELLGQRRQRPSSRRSRSSSWSHAP